MEINAYETLCYSCTVVKCIFSEAMKISAQVYFAISGQCPDNMDTATATPTRVACTIGVIRKVKLA